MMRRRTFIAGLGSAAAWPFVARAQQRAIPLVGLVSYTQADYAAAFRQGLSEAGFVEGQNVSIEYSSADDQPERFKSLVADMVRRNVSVIAATDVRAALVAKEITSTIPIVFATGGDPVGNGLVASLNRPGGNVTGATFVTMELAGKRLGLLRSLLPGAKRVGFLNDPLSRSAKDYTADVLAAGDKLGQRVFVVDIGSDHDFEAEFARLGQQADALMIGPYPLFLGYRKTIVTLAERYKLPTFYNLREFPAAGGLLSYGASFTDMVRQAGIYTGLVLRGAKPADLPVMQPAKFEFVINLKAAKTINLDIPLTLLAIADEVIE